MKDECFTLHQILDELTGDEPHFQACASCKGLLDVVGRYKRTAECEGWLRRDIMERVRCDMDAGGIAKQIDNVPEDGRLEWILERDAATPALAVMLAVRARSVIYQSPMRARRWLDLADAVLDHSMKHSAKFTPEDRAYAYARLCTIHGSFCVVQGGIVEAHRYYLEARDLFLCIFDEYAAALLVEGLTQTYTLLGQAAQAKTLCLETLPILREYGQRRYYLRLMSNLSSVLFNMGCIKRALRISAILSNIEDLDAESLVNHLRNHALILFELKKYEETDRFIKRILSLSREKGFELEIARSMWLLGEIAIERGDFNNACEILTAAKEIFQREGDHLDAFLCDAHLAHALIRLQHPEEAFALLSPVVTFLKQEKVQLHLSGILDLWMEAIESKDPVEADLGRKAHKAIHEVASPYAVRSAHAAG